MNVTKEMLKQIKEFAEENWNNENENEQVYVDALDRALTNPWIDYSGRFPLDDVGAVKEWGLEAVISFCEKAKEKLNERSK